MMRGIQVLVVDDDDLFLKSITKELRRAGYSVRKASTAEEALAELRTFPADVVLLDIRLPDKDGLTVLQSIKEKDLASEVIMLTGHGSIGSAVDSLRAGAFHYLLKPAKLAEIEALIQKAFERKTLSQENRSLKAQLRLHSDQDRILGQSKGMTDLMNLVEKVSQTNQTVLIQGESGTGKELIARRIHRLSPRRDRPFVLVDCASLNKGLLESELFGHEKGAFTGASAVKHGLIEAAHTGTLFVDEVGSLELGMQADFLRMLERQEYRRVGGTTLRRADLRIVAATNADLAQLVRDGEFREDLFFRLSVIVLQLPPLRERKDDIGLLADHFLELARHGGQKKELSLKALAFLEDYDWPGNVRELRNVIERAVLLSEGNRIELSDLRMLPIRSNLIVEKLLEPDELMTMREMQRRYMKFVLKKVDGHQQKAAQVLGIDPKTIYRTLQRKDP